MKPITDEITPPPEESKELALYYMRALADVARECFLILDANLNVTAANPMFYRVFHVSPEQTIGRSIRKLGNGQWDVPVLMDLLNEVLPEQKVVKNFEVTHIFETIGERTIRLNARQIDAVQLIILAMEDITDQKRMERKMAEYTHGLESQVRERTKELTDRLQELEALNKTMVGRELKMVELKKEIKDIKADRRPTSTA